MRQSHIKKSIALRCAVSCMAGKSSRWNLSGRIHPLRTPASADAKHHTRVWSRTVNRFGGRQTTTLRARPRCHATDAVAGTSAEGADWWTGKQAVYLSTEFMVIEGTSIKYFITDWSWANYGPWTTCSLQLASCISEDCRHSHKFSVHEVFFWENSSINETTVRFCHFENRNSVSHHVCNNFQVLLCFY